VASKWHFALTQFLHPQRLFSQFSLSARRFYGLSSLPIRLFFFSLCASAYCERMNGHIVRRRRPIQKTPLSHMLRVKSNQRRRRPPLFSEYSHISSANEAPWWRFITLCAVTKMNWKPSSDRRAHQEKVTV
jgi:hypothetical protein